MVRSSGGVAKIPSLGDVDTSGNAASASLRGNYHNKVPEISGALNTLMPVLKDGSLHPEPYYITQNVVLKISDGVKVPWADNSRAKLTKSVADMFNDNVQFRNEVLLELIKDCLHMEVAGIVSSTLAEHKEKDREKGAIHAWLEDHVVTDTVYVATEDIVWEALWDQARKLKKREIQELEQKYVRKKNVDSHMLNLLREHYTKPLNCELGQSILNHKWSELLYHTNRYMQRGSLMENYAIRKLQEQIICQIAAKVLLDESMKCVEQEMTSLDEEERIDRPPKKIEVEARTTH